MSQLMSPSRRSLQAVVTLLAVTAAAAATVQAPAMDAACHNDIVALRSTCYEYVQEGAPTLLPSPSCCATMIGVTNVRCVCDYLGSDMNVDLDKVFYVTRQCGVTIPRNCGGEYFCCIGYGHKISEL
ncbi:unnamed protein product [Urochloa humidicola]